MKLVVLTAGALILGACSSAPPDSGKKTPDAALRVPASSNPAARHLELVGFRVSERTPGRLQIQFGVVNHSDADLGDISLDVSLRTTTSKESDAPLVEFNTKVIGVGPQDLKLVSVDVPSKLRPYELPDWQFLRADFRLGEPK
jgi:hypothetical protein